MSEERAESAMPTNLWNKSIASRVFAECSTERRRVVATWRIHLLVDRVTRNIESLRVGEHRVAKLIRTLVNRGELERVRGINGVFIINIPFAESIQSTEEQVVQEANPYCSFSHLTALTYHSLVDEIPKKLFATYVQGSSESRIPFGTKAEEWIDIDLPRPLFPKEALSTTVSWSRQKGGRDFGVIVGTSAGLPIYITDPERTLLDCLREPEKGGGITLVLRAWRGARDRLKVDRLIEYTEYFKSKLMRQRVGFLLDRLELGNSKRREWRQNLQRGGSVKLVSNLPYSPTFDESWNLSINVPRHVLGELCGG